MDLLRRRGMMGREKWGILQGTGAYIPLGYYATPNTRVEIEILFGSLSGTGSNNCILSQISDNQWNSFQLNISGSNSTDIYFWNDKEYGHGGATKRITNLSQHLGHRIILKMGKEDSSNYGTLIDSTITSVALNAKTMNNSNESLLLGGYNGGPVFDRGLCVVYSVRFYESDVLAANYVPFDNNGVIGLKEVISDRFCSPLGGVFSKYIPD